MNSPDSLFNEAIASAMKEVARDCRLLPDKWGLALVGGQYKYPLPEELDRIYAVYYIDSDGTHEQLDYMAEDNYLAFTDPTEVQSEPQYFSYPHFETPVFELFAGAPPIYDYVTSSYITTASYRTVIDSGINFGRTKSGRRIRPGCYVNNITDGSGGFVQYLDMATAKTSGTATANTTTDTLEDSLPKDFDNDGVEVGDIVCTPSTGEVLAYAFVIEVGIDTLRYADVEGQDANGEAITRFESGDTYKVGTATECRLWFGRPVPEGTRVSHAGWNHPGLRQGATNDFSVSATKATITGTTFTATTVTGSSTSGAEEDDIAIASGGSHGLVSGVDDNELTVDKWIGGLPSDAEAVTVVEADRYSIEDRFATQRQIWIGPPSESAAEGSEDILLSGYRKPRMPLEDDDPLEIPEHYEQPLIACSKWQFADLQGIYSPVEVASYETLYIQEVKKYTGDVDRPPYNKPISPWRNRTRVARGYGRRDQTRNGLTWDTDI